METKHSIRHQEMKRGHAKKRGTRKIQDEFAALPVSRQRKGQLRRQRDGLCIICGQPRCSAHFCLKHFLAARERQRNKLGSVKRNFGSRSYQLEALGTTALKQRKKFSARTK
jgi:hypothetical protein